MALRFPGRYLNYPHNNTFWRGQVLLASLSEGRFEISSAPMEGGTPSPLAAWSLSEHQLKPPFSAPYFDAAGERLVACVGHDLYACDLARPQLPPRKIFQGNWHEPTSTPNLHPSGKRVLVHGRHQDGTTEALELDVESGAVLRRWTYAWWANHFHYVPHDPEWIAYCHEGPTETVPDRVWIMHPEKLPRGRCVFSQDSGTPGVKLCVGHERWGFHDLMGVAPGYGVSPAGPRGLYAVYGDGRPARLLGGGDRDWHADLSRDGRLALIDTTGPHDRAGRGWENAAGISDILLMDVATGARRFLARASYGAKHPWHPHPVFSPDGKFAWYNDWAGGKGGASVIEV